MGIAAFTLLFVIALSLDSFGVGCIIGMKKILLTARGVITIGLVSGSCFLFSSYLGELVLPFISEQYANRIGACTLIAIGLFYLIQNLRNSEDKQKKERSWTQPARVFQDPEAADIDHSGGIRGKEVLLLGAALSFDSFGAGVSGALIGVSPLLTSLLISISTSLMLFGGILSGSKLSNKIDKLSIIPGLLLIMIGIIKLI
ncbi:manganese efflux pump [Halobacillus rhizosphaerae]|uniref:manganese efflux pump n=1 Tax=Halobacillus rhizosphaerae TaxID=3064889 RepID=UPI00398A88CF